MTHCEESIRKFPLPVQPCLVGFSGGGDSTALLLLLHHCGWPAVAVHFNHHLRGEAADGDARWCRDFCRRRGIPFTLVDLDVTGCRLAHEGIEGAARRLRLEYWRDHHEGRPVFLAHHADDALEELIMRLVRGANVSGLIGLRPLRKMGGALLLCRPLLECRKRELEDYLRRQEVGDWRLDATNQDCGCRRNAIRNRLLPLMREIFGGDQGFVQSLAVLSEEACFLESEAARYAPRDMAQWREVPPALLPRVLRRCLGLDTPPSGAAIRRLREALRGYGGGIDTMPLGGGTSLMLSPEGLALRHVSPPPPDSYLIHWNWRRDPQLRLPNGLRLTASLDNGAIDAGDKCVERFDAAAMPDVLVVRSWQPGDAMIPFGQPDHHASLKKILNAARIHGGARQACPVVCAGEAIIWIPGVRRAEFGRLADVKSRAVTLRCGHQESESRELADGDGGKAEDMPR